jgi:hypothetical protein
MEGTKAQSWEEAVYAADGTLALEPRRGTPVDVPPSAGARTRACDS